MKYLLVLTILFVALPALADPPDPPFCAAALAARTPCASSVDCSIPTPLCTRDFNRQLHHAWTHGSCVDPDANISATWAIQADLCTIPHPRGWGASTPYYLPAATRLWIDDPDMDGVAITIFRRVLFEGQGASLATNAFSSLKYAALRVVVPLLQDEGWQYPPGEKYAAFSTIRDIAITAAPINHPNQNIGLLIQAHNTKVENVKCWSMGLCKELDSSDYRFNADMSSTEDLTAFGSYGAAVWMHGPDSNGFTGINWEMNSGPGLRASNYLQATLLGMKCEDCNGQSNHPAFLGGEFSFYISGNNIELMGGYLEENQPKVFSLSSTLSVFGGNFMTRIDGPAERFGGTWSKALFRSIDSPYELQFASPYGAIFVQARPNNEGIPPEDYGWGLKVRCFGTDCRWGWQSEDNAIMPAVTWRSSNNAGLRGQTRISGKLLPMNLRTLAENTQTLCCDGVDNDGDGDTDFADSQCDPNTMEC